MKCSVLENAVMVHEPGAKDGGPGSGPQPGGGSGVKASGSRAEKSAAHKAAAQKAAEASHSADYPRGIGGGKLGLLRAHQASVAMRGPAAEAHRAAALTAKAASSPAQAYYHETRRRSSPLG